MVIPAHSAKLWMVLSNKPDGAHGWLPLASVDGFWLFMVWFPFFGLARPAVAHPGR
jgi:hypothetical protein